RHGALHEHMHKWAAPQSLTDAELETPDAPRVRSVGFLNTPRSVSFLRCVLEYGGEAEFTQWHAMVWQPAYAAALEPALRFSRFPEEGFAARAEFYKWWDKSSFPLFNRLHDMTVAD